MTAETSAPARVWTGSFCLFGVDLKCWVLEDGTRECDSGDYRRMQAAKAAGAMLDPVQRDMFQAWVADLPTEADIEGNNACP